MTEEQMTAESEVRKWLTKLVDDGGPNLAFSLMGILASVALKKLRRQGADIELRTDYSQFLSMRHGNLTISIGSNRIADMLDAQAVAIEETAEASLTDVRKIRISNPDQAKGGTGA